MEQMYAFHKTVHGYGHQLREQPCEDASGSYCAEDGAYLIAVVADGHGQERSFRSAAGARMAVETAMQCLQELARAVTADPEEAEAFYTAVLSGSLARKTRIRQLTDTILSRWMDRVRSDYARNPPDAQELGPFAQFYQEPRRIPVMYGTTLIAALWLPKCLLLLHQGDGRCDVFYEDGSVDQPIPWDERCVSPVSTSLCEPDAPDRIRHCVIDLTEKPVLACYLGSDGVDDCYRSQEGTHFFYRSLSCRRSEMDAGAFEAYLEEWLPKVSRQGSRDDISVAGIVDLKKLPDAVPQMQPVMERFFLEQSLLDCEEALNAKKRKHALLKQKARTAEENLEAARQALDAAREQYDARSEELERAKRRWFEELWREERIRQDSLDRMEEVLLEKEKQAEAANQDFEKFDTVYQQIQEQITALQAKLDALGPEEETQ
ncbi:MAG: protein phosphatase 2C domain-containing protein [Faecousia sp.]